MCDDYNIILEGDELRFERMIYPRLIVIVDYFDPLLTIKKIELLEKCDPPDMKKALLEIEQYLGMMV